MAAYDSDERVLDTATLKVMRLLGPEVREAAESGTCGVNLFCVGKMIKVYMKCDVRVNEGWNSLLKTICTRCRRIGLALLSARVNLKKFLGVGSRSAPSKWSVLKPRVEQAMKQCLESFDSGYHDVQGDEERWAPPAVDSTLAGTEAVATYFSGSENGALYGTLLQPRQEEFCHAHVLQLHRLYPEPTAKVAFHIRDCNGGAPDSDRIQAPGLAGN